MTDYRATVVCSTCGLEESYSKLADARLHIEEHREETGHDPDWKLGRFAPGVEQMGSEAGVCGIPDR
jgi:hypothetical protein